jgi:hypothetical protein
MHIKNIYVFACDLESNRGEGLLGLNFIKLVSKFHPNITFECVSPKAKFFLKNNNFKKVERKNNINVNFKYLSQYIFPFIGIILLWINFFKKKKLIYLNFLPLWNFFIFLLAPPGTKFGPITGSEFKENVNGLSDFIRKYIFPLLYTISLKFIYCRKDQALYSSDLLKNFLFKKKIKDSLFYLQIRSIGTVAQKKKKKYDFVIYYRKYHSKDNYFIKEITNFLVKNNYKVIVIGNRLSIPGIKNLGFISRKKTLALLKFTKFTFNPPENFYSMFFIDSYNSGVKIFYNKSAKPKIFFVKKNIIGLNYKNIKKAKKIIKIEFSKKYIIHSDPLYFKNKFKKFKIQQDTYLKNLF